MAQKFDMLLKIREMWPDFEVSENDIKYTPPDFVQRFYYTILNDFNVTLVNMNQMEFDVSTRPVNPEMIEHMVPIIKLFVLVKKLLSDLKVYDFTILDITEPRPKKTHKFMKALISFWMHSNQKMHQVQRLIDINEEKKKSVTALQGRRHELRTMLNNYREQQAAKAIEAEECRQDISVLISEIQALDKEIKASEAEEQAARQSLAQLGDKVNNLERQTVWKENSVKEIQKQLVSSPQRMLSKKMELKQQVAQRKEHLDQMKTTFYNAVRLNEAFQQSVPIQKNLIDLCNEAIAVQNKIKELSASLQSKKSALQQQTQELNCQASAIENLRIQDLQLEEEQAGKETAIQDRLRALDQELEYLRKEKQKVKKAFETSQLEHLEKLKEGEKKIAKKDSELNAMMEKVELKIEKVVSKFESVMQTAKNLYKIDLLELGEKMDGDSSSTK